MKDHRTDNRNDDMRNSDDDQLRDSTMNETIREVHGDPDMNLNNIRDSDEDSFGQDARSSDIDQEDSTQGVSNTPNDASGVRSGGTAEKDDKAAGGAGFNKNTRPGAGSHITPKLGRTGSEYDGQVINS